MDFVLHGIWHGTPQGSQSLGFGHGALRLWAETREGYVAHAHDAHQGNAGGHLNGGAMHHPFAATSERVAAILGDSAPGDVTAEPTMLPLRLPRHTASPLPSVRLAGVLGTLDELPDDVWLDQFEVPCITLAPEHTLAALLRLESRGENRVVQHGHSLRYWMAVARFVLELLADQRFIPTLIHSRGEGLHAAWQPWLHDEGIRSRVGALIAAMPAICRSAVDEHRGNPWLILSDALRGLTDATIRSTLLREGFGEALEELDGSADPHVAWLDGLLGRHSAVTAPKRNGADLLRDAGQWVGRLDEAERSRPLRLCFKLNEPIESAMLADNEPIPEDLAWRLSLHLQSAENPERIIDAEQLWAQPAGSQVAGMQRVEHPQELMLSELGRAGRIFSRIEDALEETAPTGVDLTTKEAYEFLREHKPVLEEAGFVVIVPAWWDEPASRLGARLQIDSPSLEDIEQQAAAAAGGGQSPGPSTLGLTAIVQYRWQIAVGNQPLSMEEFQRLAGQSSPLVRVQGRWVEIRPDDMAQAMEFLNERPGGEMTLLEAIRVAHGADGAQAGLPVSGLDATGWVSDLLAASEDQQQVPMLDQPDSFQGELRPYQRVGLSWMSFLDRFGLGACLADDMGLGKTIQLIALLLHERVVHVQRADSEAAGALNVGVLGPTLLIVPTSVVSNWVRELQRFAPTLSAYVHHGPDRRMDDAFVETAQAHDVVITTYALVSRDRKTLERIKWRRVVLDEAQYIKNPPTKQTAAIRALTADRRLALTGTPVENRLSELWSIMEFCNPGYLGTTNDFRTRFAIPIERHRDQNRAGALRQIVRPFVLRRVKTDPKVISDLPPCVETKEYATLTPEQAAAYERIVNEMLEAVDKSEGIQRRGLVLATLVKLKQICNYPVKLHNGEVAGGNDELSRRSGKTQRLLTLLEEVLATDGKALIFTQFRQMGHLLTLMLRQELDCDALFLHGGTPQAKRQQMIDRFQSPQGASVFVLSLKAGGLGLNLTAANHVFHFDRWWNPAVENQATDRAFRIGQTRKVHVHKFVCVGTLEERIDQMIEQKTELAENIIGAGEQWITELSTGQLHDLLTLRRSALEGDA